MTATAFNRCLFFLKRNELLLQIKVSFIKSLYLCAMIKKITAYCLLVLANVIILVHAVVPHMHDHNGKILYICYFLTTHNSNEHTPNCDHPQSHSHAPIHKNALAASHTCHLSENHHHHHHHHHDSHPGDFCLLNTLYVPANTLKFQTPSQDSDLLDFADTSLPLFAQISTPYCNLLDYGNLPFRQKPYILSLYCLFASHSLGLRAPPLC